MTTLKTKEYTLDLQLVSRYVRATARRPVYLVIGVIAVVILLAQEQIHTGPVIFVLIVLGLYALQYEASLRKLPARLAAQEAFSQPRWNEIDDQSFTVSFKNGVSDRSPLENLVAKAEKHQGYYVLHLKRKPKSVTFIPLDAFETDADRQQFEAILARHGVVVSSK